MAMIRKGPLFTLPVLTLVFTALAAERAAAECFADWSVAAQLVAQERLLTVEQVSAARAGAVPGQILKTTLCKEQGGYVYRLVVRDQGGQLKSVTVDAQNHDSPVTSR